MTYADTAFRARPRRRLPVPALLAALVCALPALGAGPAQANPQLPRCLAAKLDSAALAQSCQHALEYGGLSKREKAVALTNLGVALSEMGRDGDAIAALDRAEKADASLAAIYVNRALARSRRGLTGPALQDWSEAIRLLPHSAEPLIGRATLQLQRGSASEALNDLNRAVQVEPGNADAHYNRGVALMSLNREGEAVEAFSVVLRIDPNDASAYLQRGLARGDQDLNAALADMDQALRLAPNWAAGWATRGQLLERAGEREAAADSYRRAFELGYQAPWLNDKIQALGG